MEEQRFCKNPGCPNPVPPRKPGHKARLTCSDGCRKAASRAHLREEARRQRQARWQTFQPATRRMLSRVEALGGGALAEHLAKAIRSEVTGGNGDRRSGNAQPSPGGWNGSGRQAC